MNSLCKFVPAERKLCSGDRNTHNIIVVLLRKRPMKRLFRISIHYLCVPKQTYFKPPIDAQWNDRKIANNGWHGEDTYEYYVTLPVCTLRHFLSECDVMQTKLRNFRRKCSRKSLLILRPGRGLPAHRGKNTQQKDHLLKEERGEVVGGVRGALYKGI